MDPAFETPTPGARLTGPPVRLRRTLRHSVRTAWDSLGLVCLTSLTLFAATLVPLSLLLRFGTMPLPAGLLAALGSLVGALFVVPPLLAGACWLANVVIERDEPSYADLWRGAGRIFGRSVALGAIQAAVKVVLLGNIYFYLSRGSFGFLLLAMIFLYLFVFWMMQVIYHYPLLVAADCALLKREDSRPIALRTILRNGLVMALTSPGYSLSLTAVLATLFVPCLLSGAGMALIFPGFAAFLMMQATRDQLVRFGMVDPAPDADEPVPDDRWRVDPGT